MAITIYYAEGSGVGDNTQGYEIAKTRERLNMRKSWNHIIADDLDNWHQGYMECIGEARNQFFEFRVSSTKRHYSRIITRDKGNKFIFHRLFGEDIG